MAKKKFDEISWDLVDGDIELETLKDTFKKLQDRMQSQLEQVIIDAIFGTPMPNLEDLSKGNTLFGLFSRDLRENLLTDIATVYGNIPIDIVISEENLHSKHVIDVKILNDEAQEVLRITIPTETFISEPFHSKRRYLAIAERVLPTISQLLEKEDEEDVDE